MIGLFFIKTKVLPMYMGVIPRGTNKVAINSSAPHVYGGDPELAKLSREDAKVLPMYMGVILPACVRRWHL